MQFHLMHLNTIEQLKLVAGSLAPCDNPKLKKRGY